MRVNVMMLASVPSIQKEDLNCVLIFGGQIESHIGIIGFSISLAFSIFQFKRLWPWELLSNLPFLRRLILTKILIPSQNTTPTILCLITSLASTSATKTLLITCHNFSKSLIVTSTPSWWSGSERRKRRSTCIHCWWWAMIIKVNGAQSLVYNWTNMRGIVKEWQVVRRLIFSLFRDDISKKISHHRSAVLHIYLPFTGTLRLSSNSCSF